MKQKTRLEDLSLRMRSYISIRLFGPWRIRSVYLLSLLIGYYFSSNLISYLINEQKQKLFILIILLLLIETVVRMRTRIFRNDSESIIFNSIDNIRLGTTYAIILEAFKLGS